MNIVKIYVNSVSSEMDYKEMAKLLSKIKGKFIISLNDGSNIRSIFKQFTFKP